MPLRALDEIRSMSPSSPPSAAIASLRTSSLPSSSSSVSARASSLGPLLGRGICRVTGAREDGAEVRGERVCREDSADAPLSFCGRWTFFLSFGLKSLAIVWAHKGEDVREGMEAEWTRPGSGVSVCAISSPLQRQKVGGTRGIATPPKSFLPAQPDERMYRGGGWACQCFPAASFPFPSSLPLLYVNPKRRRSPS